MKELKTKTGRITRYGLDRVELVQTFDKLCDECVELFASYCDRFKVVEKEVVVPKKITVLEEK